MRIFFDEASRSSLQRTKIRPRFTNIRPLRTKTHPRRTKTRNRSSKGEVRHTNGDLALSELHILLIVGCLGPQPGGAKGVVPKCPKWSTFLDMVCKSQFGMIHDQIIRSINPYFSVIFLNIFQGTCPRHAGITQKKSSGYKVGHPSHSKYVWVGQYEPSCLKFPSSVLEDKL